MMMPDDTEEDQLSRLIDVLVPFSCHANCYYYQLSYRRSRETELLGIDRSLAYRRASSGELPVIRLGRRLSKPALDRLLEIPLPLEPSVAKQNERKALLMKVLV